MKKKVFITILIILILLLGIIGLVYFTYSNNKINFLARNDVINPNENTTDISTDNTMYNEITTETSTITPEVEKETKINDEAPKKDETIVENTVTTVSTSNNITKNTTSNNKNTQKNNKVTNKEESPKATPPPSNIESKASKETTSSKSVDKPNESNIVTQPARCTNDNNHSMTVGNSGKWFNSKNKAISYYEEKIEYWDEWWNSTNPNDTNADTTYYKNCPTGYEVWNCMYCNKWTINFYYR